MKPVAWLNESGTFSKEQLSPDAEALYTADQLRAAQVAVLREAAEKVMGVRESLQFRRMADDLESTAPTPHNPHEAADTPQTLHSPDTPNS